MKMSELTTLKIGGKVKSFKVARTEEELIKLLKGDFMVIGGGSNLLVSDEGIDKLVIKNEVTGIELKRDAENGATIIVKSGTVLQDLVDYTIEHGVGGMYKMTGVPVTVGGAVYGKAGAYGHNISDYLVEVTVYNPNTKTKETFTKEQCQFGYRDSIFKKNHFTILEVKFSGLPNDDQDKMKAESSEVLKQRAIKYPPKTKCPGSFFKNISAENLTEKQKEQLSPFINQFNKIPTGKLIEAVGGRGDQLGQIKIADNHGNTFINLGGGTAEDFYNLAKKYFTLVKEKFDIELEPEVQLINLPPFK